MSDNNHMITLNRIAEECRQIALDRKKITVHSSHKGLCIGISAEWRELFDAGKHERSVHIPQYSAREEEAADVIIATLTYLKSIGCKNIEQLIKDKVEYNRNRR